MQAMLGMVKLDIEGLKRAYEEERGVARFRRVGKAKRAHHSR